MAMPTLTSPEMGVPLEASKPSKPIGNQQRKSDTTHNEKTLHHGYVFTPAVADVTVGHLLSTDGHLDHHLASSDQKEEDEIEDDHHSKGVTMTSTWPGSGKSALCWIPDHQVAFRYH